MMQYFTPRKLDRRGPAPIPKGTAVLLIPMNIDEKPKTIGLFMGRANRQFHDVIWVDGKIIEWRKDLIYPSKETQ